MKNQISHQGYIAHALEYHYEQIKVNGITPEVLQISFIKEGKNPENIIISVDFAEYLVDRAVGLAS